MPKFLIIFFALLALYWQVGEAGKTKDNSSVFLQSAPFPPPENYQNRIVSLIHYSADVNWSPIDSALDCLAKLVVKQEKNLDAPLVLEYSSEVLQAQVFSVASTTGIDSFAVHPDSMLVYFSSSVDFGIIDTVTISFRNRVDMISGLYPDQYPVTERYYGMGFWCPFPLYQQGLFTIGMNITAPESLVVVACGEKKESVMLQSGYVTHRWQAETPNISPPIVLIDRFSLSKYSIEGCDFTIYHYQRPDSLLTLISSWVAEAYSQYKKWYGAEPCSELNVVDNLILDMNAFSTPGTVFLGKYIFENRVNDGFINFSRAKLVAHEIAHQWWSHRIQSLEHRKLMESFSEYSAINAVIHGSDSLTVYFGKYLRIAAKEVINSGKDLPLTQLEGNNFYAKGPWVLYMLEKIIGREAFFAALREFQEDFQFQETYLDDFFGTLQKHYNGELDWFREQWFERAGMPMISCRKEIRQTNQSYRLQLIIKQATEPFSMPVEIGLFPKGSSTPTINTFWLDSTIDTLSLTLHDLPDSVVIDPNTRTLIYVTWELSVDVLAYGDTPNNSTNYDISFYIDSTRVIEEVNVIYNVDGRDQDTIVIDPSSLISGYGTFSLPPQASCSRVNYFLSYREKDGVENSFPRSAPDSMMHFEIKEPPKDKDRIYITFSPSIFRSVTEDISAFKNKQTGIIGFDARTLQPFGTINGVGNSSPQLDTDENLLITYNHELNSIDIIDADRWRLRDRSKLADSIVSLEISALDISRNTYFLLGDSKVLAIDLTNGKSTRLLEDESNFGGFSWLPRQMKYYDNKNLLLVKAGLRVFFIDAATGEKKNEIVLSQHDMPYLKRDGTLFTVGVRADGKRQDCFYLLANWFNINEGELELIRSLHSTSFEIAGVPHAVIVNGGSVDYCECPEMVVIKLGPGANVNNTLLWDLSGSKDTLSVYSFSHYYSHFTFAQTFTSLNNRKAIITSSVNSTLSIINMESMQLEAEYFSPFTGEIYNTETQSPHKIVGLVLPDLVHGNPYGDINSDNNIDILDLIELLIAIKTDNQQSHASDLNCDSKIDIFDLIELLKLIRYNILSFGDGD